MRIEQNLLRRNPVYTTNGHHNGNGLHNSNNNNSLSPTNLSNNKRNQGKEVGQDIPVRKSTLQETENEDKPSFLNPELQRELNRILAEAEGDGKLSEDSSVSGCSTSSASSSEEEDDYEHPRRLFLEEIAEEDEDDLEEDKEVEEEEEEDDDEDELDDEEDVSSDEELEGDVEDDKPTDVLINPEENPITAVDDTTELELSSDFASDSDATITNELTAVPLPHEEIETREIKAKFLQASRQFRREHETRRNGKNQVEILLKVENVDGQSAVENEWGKEQIDEAPKETSAEHARGETGISTKQSKQAAYKEPVVVVEKTEQRSQHSQPYSSHLHGKYLKEAALQREEHKQDNPYPERGGVSSNGESVTGVSQQQHQLLKFLQREEEQSDSDERNSDSAYPTPYSCNAVAGQVDEYYDEKDENDKDVDYDYEDDDEDDDEEEDSDSSSMGGFQELEQKQHEHVEIRLFHDDDGSCSSVGSNSAGGEVEQEQDQYSGTSSRDGNAISRDWNGPVLVDLEQASTEVHELVPESPGESGTGSSSSSSLSSSSSPTPPSQPPPSSLHPLKSSSLSSEQSKSSYLLGAEEKTSNENVSQPVGDSYSFSKSNPNTATIAPPPPPPLPPAPPSLPISNNSSKNKWCNPSVRVVSSSLKKSTVPVTSSSLLCPSILVISPRTSPSSSSETSSTSTSSTSSSKKKRVSFHEQIESKTFYCGDEPSSVSSSVSDFNPSQKDDSVIIVSSLRKKRSSNNSDHSSDLTVVTPNSNPTNNNNNNNNDGSVEQELNSSFSASSSAFYNNCQFSTADFWAGRNGAGDNKSSTNNKLHQQQQYLQSFYYSESDNTNGPRTTPAEELFQQRGEQPPPQQFRQPSNHHYYYPTEYFTLSDSSPQKNTLGLPSPPPVVVVESELPSSSSTSSSSSSTSSISGKQFWSKAHHPQEPIQQKGYSQEEHHSGGRTPAGAVVVGVTTKTTGVPSPSAAAPASTTSNSARPTSVLDNNRNAEMHQRLSGGEQRLRSVLRKPGVGGVKKTRGERSVTFNESLNLFYEAECSCWIHEDDYHRLRQEEQAQQQQHQQQHQHHQHQHHQHHQQFIYEQTHPHFPHTHHHHQNFIYEPPPIEFEDPPTLSPPEGYKDRFFPQEDPTDPDVTRVCPPSPPSARRKVFLKENSTDQLPPPPPQQKGVILNGLEDEEEDDESRKSGGGNSNSGSNTSGSKGSRLGGILKGGRLWRSNSAEGKKVTSPPDEPDVVKCTERDSRERLSDKDPSDRANTVSVSSGPSSPSNQVQTQDSYQMPTKVSTGTAPLRTSEQIRLAVDSTLRLRTKKTKPECSSLVEKLRWLTSLDDDDPSDSSSQSGFATWPSRDKNGSVSSTSSSKKSDAGTSTNEEFVNSAGIRQPPPIYSSSEAKIKQISYTLEDIDEGLKGSEIELESFITEDGGRIERLKKRYSGEEPGDDYGFSRRPSVKGIKPKFSSTNQIFAQYTAMRASGTETPVPVESQYENTRGLPPPANFDQIPNHLEGARMQLNYDIQNATGRPPEESRAHFEMIRQSFEHAASFSNFNRPHSWSVSTLPHPHHAHAHSNSISIGSAASPVPPTSGGGGMPPNLLSNNFGSSLSVSQPMQQQNNLSMNPSPINMNNAAAGVGARAPDGVPMMAGNPAQIYGTLPSQAHMAAQQNQAAQAGQAIYGTVRRVPNVIGRPLFLHYGALSVEAHPNKIVQPFPRPTKVPETPSPTQQPPPLRYYGPPIRYYNSPPPVPPRDLKTSVSGNPGGPGNGVPNPAITDCQQERGVPEGATDEEPSLKESYSMNV